MAVAAVLALPGKSCLPGEYCRWRVQGLLPDLLPRACPSSPASPPRLFNAGVRKHARKTHMAWLKSTDEAAGSRDRQYESKPSTYCTMELVDADEAEAENQEPSPALLPTPVPLPTMADIPALSLRVQAEPTTTGFYPCGVPAMPLPEGSSVTARGSAEASAVTMAQVMAQVTAASAIVHGGAPPPPLAWLFSHSVAMQALAQAHGSNVHASNLSSSSPPPHSHAAAAAAATFAAAAAAAAAAQGGAPLPSALPPRPALPPQWTAAHELLAAHLAAGQLASYPAGVMAGALGSGCGAGVGAGFGVGAYGAGFGAGFGGFGAGFGGGAPSMGPASPLAPMAAPGNWDDLDELFARATDGNRREVDEDREEADDEDRDRPGDPLCLSPPLASAMAAVRVDGAMSPFDLESESAKARAERPTATASHPASPPLPASQSASPQTTMIIGLESQAVPALPTKLAVGGFSPTPPAPAAPSTEELIEDGLGSEVNYTDFLETLLTVEPVV